jgi:hypothetical protein
VSGGKTRPYEHLSDQDLNRLVDEAADLRLRLALLRPEAVAATMIAHGCPRREAHKQVGDPVLRGYAARFHLDVADAALGYPQARARVEHCELGWERLRRAKAGAEARAEEGSG